MRMNWIQAAVVMVPVLGFAGTASAISHGSAGHSCPSCAIAASGARAGGEALVEADGTAELAPFQIGDRWTRTATNPNTGGQGDPITLRWGIVADGTSISAGTGAPEVVSGSILRSFLDSQFGAGPGGSDLTQRPWFSLFSSSFNRWSQLAGLSYVYEPNDDGVQINGSTSTSFQGVVGVRGDVRIGGHSIDGQAGSNILAYNYFPDGGEMVIDTDNTSFYVPTGTGPLGTRNVIMHEHGHGLGFNHVESNNSTQLMEPFVSVAFDGPQLDDVLAVQRNYGDAREKGNGNDTAASADSLGTFVGAGSASVGTNGATTFVAPTDADFLSIDDESDTDLFSFTVLPGSQVTLTLDPKGPTYNQGPQGSGAAGTQTSFNASLQNDLTLSLIGSDGTTVLDFANAFGLGGTETLSEVLLLGGTYYAKIAGLTVDTIQLYQLDLAVALIPEPATLAAASLLGVGLLGRRRRRTA